MGTTSTWTRSGPQLRQLVSRSQNAWMNNLSWNTLHTVRTWTTSKCLPCHAWNNMSSRVVSWLAKPRISHLMNARLSDAASGTMKCAGLQLVLVSALRITATSTTTTTTITTKNTRGTE